MATRPRRPHDATDAARALNSLRRVVRALRVAQHETERAVGVSAAQLYLLQELAWAPGQSLNDLSARTLTHQSTISEMVARLVNAGLVARRPSRVDRRRAELSVTTKGASIVRAAPPTVQQRLVKGFQMLPASRRRALASALEAWLSEAGLADVPAEMFFERPASRGVLPSRPHKA